MNGYCGDCHVSFTTLDEWEAHQHRRARPFCRFHHSYVCRCPYISTGSQLDVYRRDHPAESIPA